MARWTEEARQRLRDGERIETTVPVGDNAVVVTTQRVFAFTPESEGSNYRAIERPNAEELSLGMVGESGWLWYTLKGAVVGAFGIGVGLTVEFASLFTLNNVGAGGPVSIDFGGLLSGLQTAIELLGYLDEALLVVGGLGAAVALTTLGVYVQSREHTLVLGVAGGADIHVPAAPDSDDVRDRLRRALDGRTATEADPPDAETSSALETVSGAGNDAETDDGPDKETGFGRGAATDADATVDGHGNRRPE